MKFGEIVKDICEHMWCKKKGNKKLTFRDMDNYSFEFEISK